MHSRQWYSHNSVLLDGLYINTILPVRRELSGISLVVQRLRIHLPSWGRGFNPWSGN